MKNIKSVITLSASALILALVTGCASSRAAQSKAPTPLPVVIVGGSNTEAEPVVVRIANPPPIVQAEKPAFSAAQTATPTTSFSAVRSTPTPASFQAAPGPAATSAPAATVNGGLGGDRATDQIELKKESMVTGVQVVPNGAVQLKKTIVTENVSTVVPVRREEYTITEIPVTDKTPKTPFETKEITIPLSREVPTGSTKAEVYRIIQVKTTTETDNPTVKGEVRTEKVDVSRQQ